MFVSEHAIDGIQKHISFSSSFHANYMKSTQCNECLAVCVNYAFCAKFTFLLYILRIFAPERPIDAIFKHLAFSGGFHANWLEINSLQSVLQSA